MSKFRTEFNTAEKALIAAAILNDELAIEKIIDNESLFAELSTQSIKKAAELTTSSTIKDGLNIVIGIMPNGEDMESFFAQLEKSKLNHSEKCR